MPYCGELEMIEASWVAVAVAVEFRNKSNIHTDVNSSATPPCGATAAYCYKYDDCGDAAAIAKPTKH